MRQTRVAQVQTFGILNGQPVLDTSLPTNFVQQPFVLAEHLDSVSLKFALLVLKSLCQMDLSLEAMVLLAGNNYFMGNGIMEMCLTHHKIHVFYLLILFPV